MIIITIYNNSDLGNVLEHNSYPGRGIIIGQTPDGENAVAAYFIMGRSENSRNRIFAETADGIRTEAFDPSKVADPSLIIYAPVRKVQNRLVVTNGDQTDTVRNFLVLGKTFEEALETRCFEPDGPNFTPRISGLLTFENESFSYKMSILKSADAQGSACARFTYAYPALPGLGHFLHTYVCDGDPIPTFQGEPERVALLNDFDDFTSLLWDKLDPNNKVSLYVNYTDLSSGDAQVRIINKNV